MSDAFFARPILNSPYACPTRHWELDEDGQPTNRILETRREADFISAVPKARRRRASEDQTEMPLRDREGISTDDQEYSKAIINEIRHTSPIGAPCPIPPSGR
jgi:type III restriction enzyme